MFLGNKKIQTPTPLNIIGVVRETAAVNNTTLKNKTRKTLQNDLLHRGVTSHTDLVHYSIQYTVCVQGQ